LLRGSAGPATLRSGWRNAVLRRGMERDQGREGGYRERRTQARHDVRHITPEE